MYYLKNFKDMFFIATIISLLVGGFVVYRKQRSQIDSLIELHQENKTQLQEQFNTDKSNLIDSYKIAVDSFSKANNYLTKKNKALNIKLKNYEKRLAYSNRTFDSAAIIITRAKYHH